MFRIIYLTFIYSLFSLALLAQSEKALEIRDAVWSRPDSAFTDTVIPDKWKEESAVILAQDFTYRFDRKGKKLINNTTFHARVALLDKNAVKEYSEFSFAETFSGVQNRKNYKGRTFTGFKIIKPDGSESIVDLDAAVPVEGGNARNSTKKIAIPDLQEGDIIDFYYHERQEVVFYDSYIFTPVLTTLTTVYPAKYIRRSFEVEKRFYINYLPLHGAPSLEQKDLDKKYVFYSEIRDVEKMENSEWMYSYRSVPTIKFQVMYATNYLYAENWLVFHGAEGEVKTEVKEDEVNKVGNRLVRSSGSGSTDRKVFVSYANERGMNLKTMSDEEITRAFYRWKHHDVLGRPLERYFLGEGPEPNLDEYSYIRALLALFRAADFEGDLIITTDREYGTLDDILLLQELGFLLRVKVSQDKYLYLPAFSLHPAIDRIPTKYEGQPALVKPFQWSSSNTQRITLPKSTAEDNHTLLQSSVSIDENMETLKVNSTYEFTGHNKDWYQYRLLTMYDFLPADQEHFGDEPILKQVKKKDKQELIELIDSYKKEKKDQVDESVKNLLIAEYGDENSEIIDYQILKQGRYEEDEFAFSLSGKVNGLMQRAGSNYLLNVGILIGSQKEIAETGRERSVDVYMSCARSFTNEVTLQIPEGYTVEGYEKLEKNISNSTGGFVSELTLEGDILKIKTNKWYADNYQPAENWPLMLEFLDAAYEFTEEKILLKKK